MGIKEIRGFDLCDERHEDLDPFCNGSAIVGVSTGHRKWLILFELTLFSAAAAMNLRLIRMYKNNTLLPGL